MSYQLGVDLGTTYSAAAVCRPGSGPAETVALGERSTAVASTVFAGDDGSFLIGEAAERRALSDPGRVVREFKRRIGDGTPVLVGRTPVPAETLAARFVSRLLDQVAAREGGRPSRLAVTHPAGWGPHKVESLRAALDEQGMASAVLLTEPQAAAVGYAGAQRVEPGAVVAVYDLGGGTFDAAVVCKATNGRFELLGTPEGLERLGGVDFDEAVFEHVRTALGPAWEALDAADPEVLAAVAALRRECTAAKEALSHDTEVLIPVMLPGAHTAVRLGRAEFEEMIRPAVLETVEALGRALDSAGVPPADLSALLLVGGSSRIPLVAQLVSAGIGRPAAVDVDPKAVIAAGAALVARGVEGKTVPAPLPVSPPPVPPPVPDVDADALPAADTRPYAAVRPPKQARPFPAVAPRSGRVRTTAVVAGVLAVLLLGGAGAFAAATATADRGVIGDEADAATPPATTVRVVPDPGAGEQPVPAPPAPEEPPAPTTSAPGGRVVAPPTTTPPTTTRSVPPPTSAPPTDPPEDTSEAAAPEAPPEEDPAPEPQAGALPEADEGETGASQATD